MDASMKSLNDTNVFEKVQSEFQEGMALKKCRVCGCMKDELEQVATLPQAPKTLKDAASRWVKEMEPIRYSCLGCEYCYPAVAASLLSTALPHQAQGPSCGLEVRSNDWPPVAGEYSVLDSSAAVAVSTLGSPEIADKIAGATMPGVCIVGKTETENIGIDKIIKNTITNSRIRYLVLVGSDVKGHLPGATLLALSKNGIDENQRVVGSTGRRPFLRNVLPQEVEIFRKQIQIVDRIGMSDPCEIASVVADIAESHSKEICCGSSIPKATSISSVEVILSANPEAIEMDRAGYFVIIPDRSAKMILVEHYAYDDRLQRVIQGPDARSIYWTIIKNGWISQLSHAAYLGKELAKAEQAIRLDLPYVQDGA